jgi:hypothetical protein
MNDHVRAFIPSSGDLAEIYEMQGFANDPLYNRHPCNPCTKWDEDGLCVTCGASLCVSQIATPGATLSAEDSVSLTAESSGPSELQAINKEPS